MFFSWLNQDALLKTVKSLAEWLHFSSVSWLSLQSYFWSAHTSSIITSKSRNYIFLSVSLLDSYPKVIPDAWQAMYCWNTPKFFAPCRQPTGLQVQFSLQDGFHICIFGCWLKSLGFQQKEDKPSGKWNCAGQWAVGFVPRCSADPSGSCCACMTGCGCMNALKGWWCQDEKCPWNSSDPCSTTLFDYLFD